MVTPARALFFIATVIATPALAMEPGQTYVSVQGGYSQPEDHDFDLPSSAKVNTKLEDGYVVVGAVGRAYRNNLRAEIEGSYRESEVDEHSTGGAPLAGSRGDAKVMAGMVNGYYDIPTSVSIKPYVGVGLGVANVDFENYGTDATGTVLDDGETVLAYQGIAGVSAPVNGRLSLTAEYRYFATADVEVNSGTQASDTEYKTHNFLLGARYAF